ncbi:hypothetical protein D1818_25150 [Aquimarina sp. BL5]|uniref:hypothetical protein n=1 Tax=Aquimarina sp. BL5 TaxID=1714860 RepID=UPI000E54C074|nr:hypothetical protein [Aquimarina sp. BL5]AXT53938.1 hypothetical protein D1818_25150 [Aquimarina sp. BL5]RKN04548.1 hypothetical protein D7036_12095 [Aquimarina sp. BL5]
MIFKKEYIFFLIGILLFVSCQKEKITPVSDNEYKLFNLEQAGWKSKSVSHLFSEIEYKATLVPLQYYILKNEGSDNLQKVDSIYESLKNERIIEVEFQQEKEDDLLKEIYTNRDYESSVKYMSFYIEKDFKVVTQKGDTVNCSGVTFERNFKVAPFKRLLLHFGNIPEQENIKLIYNDNLFGNGLMKFNFKETPIKL